MPLVVDPGRWVAVAEMKEQRIAAAAAVVVAVAGGTKKLGDLHHPHDVSTIRRTSKVSS